MKELIADTVPVNLRPWCRHRGRTCSTLPSAVGGKAVTQSFLRECFGFYPSIPVEPTLGATEQRRPILAQFKAASWVNGY